MSARENILDAVRRATLPPRALPDVAASVQALRTPSELVSQFVAAAEIAGAAVVRAPSADVPAVCDGLYRGTGRRVSVIGPRDVARPSPAPHAFADTDVFCCEAAVGIAENGAVWLPLSRLHHRAALFLATNVIVVLDANAIVATFQNAYESVDVSADAFGVFVAGPSKTADIEQSLVVGAHGPKAVTVVLSHRSGSLER